MADALILMAEPRTVHGKQVKRLRREGLVPGVVYGPVIDNTISVSVERRVFDKFYMQHGHSTIFKLKWDGGEETVVIGTASNKQRLERHRFEWRILEDIQQCQDVIER